MDEDKRREFFEKQYQISADGQIGWISTAFSLLVASDRLAEISTYQSLRKWLPDYERLYTAADLGPWCFDTIQMLRAMGVECLLKGVLSQHEKMTDDSHLQMRVEISRGHPLPDIARRVEKHSQLTFSDVEMSLLARLEKWIMGARFPVSRKFEYVPSDRKAPGWRMPQDEDALFNLQMRLREQLGLAAPKADAGMEGWDAEPVDKPAADGDSDGEAGPTEGTA